ncbi:MATE family efflux transporter [Tepiditoga spiralis]|uniref:MATE family efflux transporter n=1 Tax=Tepiditoga spiralis TaxID=2108365 RepID=A0A7G1GBG5_9BACT|nr:MATE family efflux transporter [Tepiditoga spiralis]BBE31059.1 MATE family efflux transporter [Tepiditoga spiralis]
MKTKIDIFKVSIWESLLKLSWPIILANIFQAVYNITDTYFLGKLGSIEIAAPTISWPLIFIFISISGGFSMAGSSMVAQYTGMKRKELAEKSAAQTILTVTLISIITMLFGLFFSKSMLYYIGARDLTLEYSLKYFNIILISTPFLFFFEVNTAILRGWGNTFTPLILRFFSITLNIILDPIFIFVFKMGVEGAAIATLISKIIFSLYLMYEMFTGKYGFKIHLKDLKFDLRYIKKILLIGLPTSFGQSVTAMGFAIIMKVVSKFGTNVVTAYGIGNRVTNLIVMVSMGISGATSIMIGQFIGSNNKNKAIETLKKASILTFFSVFILSFFLFLYGKNVTSFFINEIEVINTGKIYFSMVSLSLPFFATMSIFLAAMNGTGHTVQTTIINLTRLWIIRIPLIKLMADYYGFIGIFYAMIISNILAMLLAYGFLKTDKWKIRLVKEYEN